MKVYFKLLVICQLMSLHAYAQVNGLSPYSRYGLGNTQLSASAQLQALSHGGVTYINPYAINSQQAASFAYVAKPIYDVSVAYNLLSLSNNNTSLTQRDFSFSGFRFLFPLVKDKAGLSMGLTPHYQSNYDINDTQNEPGIGDVLYEYQGEGGINKAYLGIGTKLIDNDTLQLAVGAKGLYYFGSSTKIRRALLPSGQNYFNVASTNQLSVSDLSLEGGVYISWTPGKARDLQFRLGSSVNLGGNLNARKTELNNTFSENGFGSTFIKDTLNFVANNSGQVRFPLELSTGVGVLIRNKWYVGLTHTVLDWTTYVEDFGEQQQTSFAELKAGNSYSLGIEYTPQPTRLLTNNFWKTVSYRLGMRIADDYIQVNDEPLKQQSLSLGLGLPLLKSRSLSSFNVGVEFGSRTGSGENLIAEDFVNIYLGMTFVPNKIDNWFIKRKYD